MNSAEFIWMQIGHLVEGDQITRKQMAWIIRELVHPYIETDDTEERNRVCQMIHRLNAVSDPMAEEPSYLNEDDYELAQARAYARHERVHPGIEI